MNVTIVQPNESRRLSVCKTVVEKLVTTGLKWGGGKTIKKIEILYF